VAAELVAQAEQAFEAANSRHRNASQTALLTHRAVAAIRTCWAAAC
jgi:hypothetical protein